MRQWVECCCWCCCCCCCLKWTWTVQTCCAKSYLTILHCSIRFSNFWPNFCSTAPFQPSSIRNLGTSIRLTTRPRDPASPRVWPLGPMSFTKRRGSQRFFRQHARPVPIWHFPNGVGMAWDSICSFDMLVTGEMWWELFCKNEISHWKRCTWVPNAATGCLSQNITRIGKSLCNRWGHGSHIWKHWAMMGTDII